MSDESFNGTVLTDKLSKLNSSQQSIESVSHWCISHRKRAKLVVETWEKLFKSAEPQQQISFLFLSNDILQNSRRKGSEFVNEFWKVLPDALKYIHDAGNENCRKVASRLVDIWEQRKVFGSRGQNLKNEMLGKDPSPANIVKNLNPIKVAKRDSTSLRVKLAVGSLPEKILTAMQLVHDEVDSEEEALNKCRNAVSCARELEKDALSASTQGNLQGSDLVDNIHKQEDTIQQCISKLEKSEDIRDALVSQLKEALLDQESKLEQIKSELLIARAQIQRAADTRLQLMMSSSAPTSSPIQKQPPPFEANTFHPPQLTTTMAPPSSMNSTDDESKKAAAAAVAAKLAASTSSAQMLTSILSSLVAEEVATMSTGHKRPKLDPTEGGPPPNQAYYSNTHQMFSNMPSQSISQTAQLQTPYPNNGNPLVLQPNSNMMGLSYGYGGAMPFAMPSGPPPQQVQPPASGEYFRPVGAGFYGQSHQPPTTPPIHRQ